MELGEEKTGEEGRKEGEMTLPMEQLGDGWVDDTGTDRAIITIIPVSILNEHVNPDRTDVGATAA